MPNIKKNLNNLLKINRWSKRDVEKADRSHMEITKDLTFEQSFILLKKIVCVKVYEMRWDNDIFF